MKTRHLFISLTIIIFVNTLQAQTSRFLIEFKNKDTLYNAYTLDRPEAFLSERALNRRARYNIPLTVSDLPVSGRYIDSLEPYVQYIQNRSKWMNAIVAATDSALLDSIKAFAFVKEIKYLAPANPVFNKSDRKGVQNRDSSKAKKDVMLSDSSFYGLAWEQISMMNGHLLHKNNYRGEGLIIAILDAGFKNADRLPVFERLWQNDQILGIRDFEDHDQEVFDSHLHGTMVFSLLGGYIPEIYIGTAPASQYWLLRTEVGGSEYLIEEYNWIAAAEFADSAGVDIINSSLGYSTFDDSTQNHRYEDMDGHTTPVSKAAAMAAAKGMLVISSAGNLADQNWQYISAPADADSIISVGAVDPNQRYAYFSSTGPTYDGRVKPELAAQGIATVVQDIDSSFVMANGTSFSAPIITGLTACLWQKYPNLSNVQIIHKLIRSAHQYASPDSLLIYGIPNFSVAGDVTIQDLGKSSIKIFPNPFQNYFYIRVPAVNIGQSSIYLEIYNMMGQKIYTRTYSKSVAGKHIRINALNDKPNGIYLVKLTLSPNFIIKQKMVKH